MHKLAALAQAHRQEFLTRLARLRCSWLLSQALLRFSQNMLLDRQLADPTEPFRQKLTQLERLRKAQCWLLRLLLQHRLSNQAAVLQRLCYWQLRASLLPPPNKEAELRNELEAAERRSRAEKMLLGLFKTLEAERIERLLRMMIYWKACRD